MIVAACLLVGAAGLLTVMSFRRGTTVPAHLNQEHPAVSALAAIARDDADFRAHLLDYFSQRQVPSDSLWRADAAEDELDVAHWRNGRHVQFLNYEPWPVPEDPDWSESPHGNRSWEFRYHSLSWLWAPASAYLETGSVSDQEEVRDLTLDWITENPRRGPPSPRSWYDHAVAVRTDVIVSLFQPVLVESLSPAQLDTLLGALHLHGLQLDRLLADPRFTGHNHNLFHALSLYNLATAFPELADASQWRQKARDRISALLGEMVHLGEGVSVEQATSYHFLALNLFADAHEFLARHDDGLEPAELRTLTRMSTFAALVTAPNGELAAIGDTEYAERRDATSSAEAVGVLSPQARFVASAGEEGTRPPDAAFFPESGYAVLRPSYGERGQWLDDLHLVVDMSAERLYHGHADTLNLILSAYGGPLVVDSGGPYAYGNPDRADFVGPAAHNTVLVDGDRDHVSTQSSMARTLDTGDYSFLDGSLITSDAVHHRRGIILVKPDLVLVIDELASIDDASHRLDLLYHFPPNATVDMSGGQLTLATEVGAGLGMGIVASGALETEVVMGRGADDPPALGWVTPAHARRVPAPVLVASQSGDSAWFVTAIAPARADAVVVPSLSATRTADGFEIEVSNASRTWRVTVPTQGDPTVRGGD